MNRLPLIALSAFIVVGCDSGEVGERLESTDPTLTVQPTNPIEPVNPIDPIDRIDPTDPTDPTEPDEIGSDRWTVTATRNSNDAFLAIDGNDDTRWSTARAQEPGQQFTIDLNAPRVFDRLVLDSSGSAGDYPREYEVEVSENGIQWSSVATGAGTSNGLTIIDFADQSASLVRVSQIGSASTNWWTIHELELFANASDIEGEQEAEEPIGECGFSVADEYSSGSDFELALTALHGHLDGSVVLTEEAINDAAASIELFGVQLSNSFTLIERAFDIIASYDEVFGPLFLNDNTQGGVERTPAAAADAIHYAIITLHQSLIDHAYTNNNVKAYRSTFEDRGYATADYFPGVIAGGAEFSTYSVEIDATNNPSASHRPYGAFDGDSRRPTGAYAPPGAIVEVNVPPALVGTGFKVRVGAHTWDLTAKNSITRLDRVSLAYDIDCSNMLVSNPLGGGIYIEVPFEANADAVDVEIRNAVRSPFYAARSFTQHTSDSEWNTEQTHGAPWADLESDHFMIQVPTPWLDEIDDPAVLMAEWDAAMQSILDLYGITETDKTMLYVQVDTILRSVANFPGYPMSNFPYNPAAPSANNNSRAFLRSPADVDYVTWHELGHQLFFTKFQGETESVVHLPAVNYMNKVFGVDLDTAFSSSSFRNPNVNLDQAFMNWAVRPNFQQGLPMRSARPNSEKLYQRRGYAHYVIIAELFGWEALERFWASEHADFANGIDYDRNSNGDGDTDSRILRMSRAAGVDLRPLLHVWGNHPESASELAADLQAENLPASSKIYDELEQYKALVPMNNAEFLAHARTIYPLLQSNSNTEAFEGWYFEQAQTYNVVDGVASQQALQSIIDLYFPDGRPADNGLEFVTTFGQPNLSTGAATEQTPAPMEVVEDLIGLDHHAAP